MPPRDPTAHSVPQPVPACSFPCPSRCPRVGSSGSGLQGFAGLGQPLGPSPNCPAPHPHLDPNLWGPQPRWAPHTPHGVRPLPQPPGTPLGPPTLPSCPSCPLVSRSSLQGSAGPPDARGVDSCPLRVAPRLVLYSSHSAVRLPGTHPCPTPGDGAPLCGAMDPPSGPAVLDSPWGPAVATFCRERRGDGCSGVRRARVTPDSQVSSAPPPRLHAVLLAAHSHVEILKLLKPHGREVMSGCLRLFFSGHECAGMVSPHIRGPFLSILSILQIAFSQFFHFSMGFGPLSLHWNNASDALAHLIRVLHVNPMIQLALILLGLNETCTLT